MSAMFRGGLSTEAQLPNPVVKKGLTTGARFGIGLFLLPSVFLVLYNIGYNRRLEFLEQHGTRVVGRIIAATQTDEQRNGVHVDFRDKITVEYSVNPHESHREDFEIPEYYLHTLAPDGVHFKQNTSMSVVFDPDNPSFVRIETERSYAYYILAIIPILLGAWVWRIRAKQS